MIRMSKNPPLPTLNATVKSLDITSVPKEREEILQPLIDYIQEKKDKAEQINLNFICTHNSRRSQFSQIWGANSGLLFRC